MPAVSWTMEMSAARPCLGFGGESSAYLERTHDLGMSKNSDGRGPHVLTLPRPSTTCGRVRSASVAHHNRHRQPSVCNPFTLVPLTPAIVSVQVPRPAARPAYLPVQSVSHPTLTVSFPRIQPRYDDRRRRAVSQLRTRQPHLRTNAMTIAACRHRDQNSTRRMADLSLTLRRSR